MANVMEEVHLTTIKPRNTVLLLAQEISFAKVLACNDKRLRDRGLKRLKKWFMVRSQGTEDFSKDDHMRIWKGLFYCMWMSDKPLVQEELAEEMSNLIHSFASFKASLLFVETFFASLSVEWFGIDQLRLDKFMMLVRRFMRQSLELVSRLDWPEQEVQQLADIYHKTLTSAPLGLSMHIIEVFCEELAKVGKGELTSSTILQFITVFARIMSTLKDGRLISQITRCIFLYLIRQTELGVEYQLKFSAWKEFGFPGGDVDAAEKIELESDNELDEEDMIEVNAEDESDDTENGVEREVGIDARAGKVDVLLPPLDFDPNELVVELRELRNKKETTTKARKMLIQLIVKFENLATGKYPLGLHKVELPKKVDKKKEITNAAKKLFTEEQKMIYDHSEIEENNEFKLKLKKNSKKMKKSFKKSVWKISEASPSNDHNESATNTYWEVSESVETVSKETQPRKRKQTVEHLSAGPMISDAKKSKFTHISVNESKENVLTPTIPNSKIKKNKKNVLKKVVSNGENITKDNNFLISKKGTISKNKKKRSKQSTNQISNDNKNIDLISKDNEKHSGGTLNTEDLQQESDLSKLPKQKIKDNNQVKNTVDLQLNTSTVDTNNGWGGDWSEPLNEGEYEIFIPNKKYVEKRKSLGLSYPVSTFVQRSAEKCTPINMKKSKHNSRLSTPSSQKKVEFNLNANCAQDFKDYKRKVKNNSAQVPFDASKKPVQGLLKNSTPSPINPFYKKSINFLAS